MNRFRFGATAFALLAGVSSPACLAQNQPPVDLTQISLEDLMNVKVNSVLRTTQTLSRTAAAIFVISQEDIRRSGAANLADLLRMVPGVDVAQIDSNAHAISIRGFNDQLADKVLVMVDGRTVYSPTTSGVNWDQQDVPLEDIDRIEVIRGPAGTVWGANAVNGVIRIMTKRAADTPGATVRVEGGSQDTLRGLLQYGGTIGKTGAYRVFEDYSNTGNSAASNGQDPAADGWHMLHSGFRSDWKPAPLDWLMVEGDFLETGEGQTISAVFANQLPQERTFNDSVVTGEGDLLARWIHVLSNGSDTSLRVYFDRSDRHDLGVHESLDTVDLDFQHHVRIGSRNDVVWGGGYRFTTDGHTPGYGKSYSPLDQANNLFSTFAQDEIAINDSLSFTLGARFEHQPYAGFQIEPTAGLVWAPNSRHTFWMSASQAVKQVSREEAGLVVDPRTVSLPDGGVGVQELSGNPKSRAERLRDYEFGYRALPARQFSLDFTTFSNYYHGLETKDAGAPYLGTGPEPAYLVLPYLFGNSVNAHTYGAELYANWNATSRWRLSPSYSAILLNLSHPDVREGEREANTPENQLGLRSLMDLAHNLEWDSSVYYVGRLRNGGDGPVPAYTRADTRFGWRLGKSFELSIVGQNLLRPLHAEFHESHEISDTLVRRSVFARITWRL